MNPLRLTVRFAPLKPVPDLEPAIGMFHRFIQNGLVEGLILDVADYRHVLGGPGVMLIGHDVDYGVAGSGLTVTRKRSDEPIANQLIDAIRMGLGAVDAIAYDGAFDIVLSRARMSVAVLDRRTPNDEVAATLMDVVQSVAADLYGPDVTVTPDATEDPRRAPCVDVRAPDQAGVDVLAKLGGSLAAGQSPWDVTVEDLDAKLKAGDEFVLLDVREPAEREAVEIGGTHIPLATIAERLDELDRSRHVVAYCRTGHRSAKAVALLRESGFDDAWSLNGGLMTWIDRIDPTLTRY